MWFEPKGLALFRNSRAFKLRGGKRKQAETGHDFAAVQILREEIFSVLDRGEQTLERGNEVRFIKNDQRIRAEQAGVIGPHLPRNAVALEQQSRANHIDSADHNDRRGRIVEPLAVVHMRAA